MALGTLEAVALLGLRVPHDIAVVSLDDLPTGHLLTSPLTTVVQPAYSMGREAMRLLLRRIASPDAAPREVRLRAAFVHRESCGCRPLVRPTSSVLPPETEHASQKEM